MKKLKLLSLLVLIPLVGGLGLLFAGSFTGNATLVRIGELLISAGVPLTMFALVVIALILMMTGKLSDDSSSSKSEDKQPENGGQSDSSKAVELSPETDEKLKRAADYLGSRGYRSKYQNSEYIMNQSANLYKNSSKKEKILGWLFFGFLMTDFLMIMVFGFFKIIAGALVCMGIFAGTIIIALIVTTIREKASVNFDISKAKDKRVLDGVVKLCSMSSQRTTGNIAKDPLGITFRVQITADGEEYNAYSKKFYEPGDEVQFAVIGKHMAAIVSDNRPDIAEPERPKDAFDKLFDGQDGADSSDDPVEFDGFPEDEDSEEKDIFDELFDND